MSFKICIKYVRKVDIGMPLDAMTLGEFEYSAGV